MAWIGAICGDMSAAKALSEVTIGGPLHGNTTIHPNPSLQDWDNRISRYAYRYYTTVGQGSQLGIFESLSGATKFWVYWCHSIYKQDSTIGSNGILSTYHDAANPVSGQLQVFTIKDGTLTTTKYGYALRHYNGTSWVTDIQSESTTAHTVGDKDFCILEVDVTAKTYSLWVNGSSIYSGVSCVVTPVLDQITFYNEAISGGKGGLGYHEYDVWEALVHDDQSGGGPTTRQTYSAIGTRVQVIQKLLTADSNTIWTPSGTCDGSRWRALADAQKNYTPPGPDYIEYAGASGSNQDQLCDVGDLGGGETIDAVAFCASGPYSSPSPADDIIATESGTTYAISAVLNTTTKYLYRLNRKSPAGNTWDSTKFNAMTAGVRRNSANANTVRTYDMCVAVIGTGLTRPTLIENCPATPPKGFVGIF